MPAEPSYNYCNQCGGDTWHSIAGQCKDTSEDRLDNGSTISFSETSVLLQCQVCKKTTDAQSLLNWQAHYDLQVAQQTLESKIKRDVQPMKEAA